jgi:hypothetical protein
VFGFEGSGLVRFGLQGRLALAEEGCSTVGKALLTCRRVAALSCRLMYCSGTCYSKHSIRSRGMYGMGIRC